MKKKFFWPKCVSNNVWKKINFLHFTLFRGGGGGRAKSGEVHTFFFYFEWDLPLKTKMKNLSFITLLQNVIISLKIWNFGIFGTYWPMLEPSKTSKVPRLMTLKFALWPHSALYGNSVEIEQVLYKKYSLLSWTGMKYEDGFSRCSRKNKLDRCLKF